MKPLLIINTIHWQRPASFCLKNPINGTDGNDCLYIGSTKRNFGERIKERMKNIQKKQESTALVKFAKEQQQEPMVRSKNLFIP